MSRPVIGISAYSERARWGAWDLPATLLPQNYADQVAAAGGAPVLLPPVTGIESAVASLDGLIISGGPDIEPARYGEQPGRQTTIMRPARDAAEVALFRAAVDLDVPVLGVCRGLQVMNVALGGTLIQHLPDVVGHEGHSPTPGTMGEHKVTVGSRPSRLARILGTGPIVVPTHHHQSIGRLADGLIVTALADDGTIEAAEMDGTNTLFVLGVQWHPEAGDDPALFDALIDAVRG
jgi:putative glutamine amidotransferase